MDTPLIPHILHPDRDAGGRFIAGNPGRPPAAEVSRLRSEAQRLLVAHFARNQDRVLSALLRQNPGLYLSMVMQAANEADTRAGPGPDPDPGAPAPVDLPALNLQAEQRRVERAARKARRRAEADVRAAASWEDWKADRAADLAEWAES